MTADKILLSICLVLPVLGISSISHAQSIKDTKKFLEYFNGIDNMISYKKLKEEIQKTGSQVQSSKSISDSNKNVLEEYYNHVKHKADSLVVKITEDLMSKEERKKMVKDPAAYVVLLNVIFDDIRIATADFNNKYTEVVGPARGRRLSLQVNDFDLPLDNDFAEELITAALKSLIKSQVKKRISLKPWDDL
jgi:hypothetical protein